MIISCAKNAFEVICGVGNFNAITFAASELQLMEDVNIKDDVLRSACKALKKDKKDNDGIDLESKIKAEASIFRAYVAHALKKFSLNRKDFVDADKDEYFEKLDSDLSEWVERTAQIPKLLTVFPESLVIIDLAFDIAQECLKRTESMLEKCSRLSLLNCAKRQIFKLACLLERMQTRREYEEKMMKEEKFRAEKMRMNCFEIAIATMLESITLSSNKNPTKQES